MRQNWWMAAPAAEECPVSDLNVTGQLHGVGHDDAVADPAIMRNMTGGHQEAVRTDFSAGIGLGGAADGHVLANDGARADTHAGAGGGIEAQILRIAADHGERMHHDALAELTLPADVGMSVDHTIGAESRTVLDQGRRMDLHHRVKGAYCKCGH